MICIRYKQTFPRFLYGYKPRQGRKALFTPVCPGRGSSEIARSLRSPGGGHGVGAGFAGSLVVLAAAVLFVMTAAALIVLLVGVMRIMAVVAAEAAYM